MRAFHKLSIYSLSILALAGCDRMITPRSEQILKDAQAKTAQNDYARAISLYEAALDDSPHSAEVHYQLALLYEDKLKDPLNALHHFKRYLALDPTGAHASEAKDAIKRDEVALVTSLSDDAVVTRAEAARLRNENLNLRRQIDGAKTRATASPPRANNSQASPAPAREPRSYVVQPGDTLFSIARKFYQSSARWKDIRDANKDKIDNPAKLAPGTELKIP
jgi:tetratricopeptide (TPR) repeat protein